jgi:hypothetical protein
MCVYERGKMMPDKWRISCRERLARDSVKKGTISRAKQSGCMHMFGATQPLQHLGSPVPRRQLQSPTFLNELKQNLGTSSGRACFRLWHISKGI